MTVAVGLVYDDKARFRSRALVRIGRPRRVEAWSAPYEKDPPAAVRALTTSLAEQLAEVAPMYASRRDELTWHRIAGIVARTDAGAVDLAARDELARALSRAAETTSEPASAEARALQPLTERYEQELALLGLSDAQVAQGISAPDYRRRLGLSLALAAASAPVAAVGTLIHAAPYAVMKQIGRRPSNEGMRATVKLLGCFTLFTTVYTTLGVVVGRRRGALVGVAAFLVGPMSDYVTVRFAERAHPAHPGGQLEGEHRPAVPAPWHPPQLLRLPGPGEQRLGMPTTEDGVGRIVRDHGEPRGDGGNRVGQWRIGAERSDAGPAQGPQQQPARRGWRTTGPCAGPRGS